MYFLFNSCGLAVLAMAALPLRVCEVAEGVVPSGNGNYTKGSKDSVKMYNFRREVLLSAHGSSDSQSDPIRSSEIHPPTLAKLQLGALSAGYSSHGEMFSARALAQLAIKLQLAYNVRLVKRVLSEEPFLFNMNRYYEHRFLNNPGIEWDVEDEEEDFAPYVARPLGEIDNAPSNQIDDNNVEMISEGDVEEPVEEIVLDSENSSDSESGVIELPDADQYSDLIVQEDDPDWRLTVVERLMRGELIAVW